MSNILEKIVANRKPYVEHLKSMDIYSNCDRKLPLVSFFKKRPEPTLICECKKRSPSKGFFLGDYIPEKIAAEYKKGGADAVSVLTEPNFFFGDNGDLITVKEKTMLPVIKKDFFFDPVQIDEAFCIGADAILLIATILSEEKLHELTDYAHEKSLQVLLEVHNKDEIEKSHSVNADAFGINARNLKDFSIDLEPVKRMRDLLPEDKLAVAESGLHSSKDGEEMRKAGFDAFLVGEYFMTAKNRVLAVSNFKQGLSKDA